MNLDLLLTMQNEDFRKTFGVRLKNLPPAEMLIKLADALATTVDYLLTGNPAEEIPLANAQLFKAVEDFDDVDQETIIKLIDAMIAKCRPHSYHWTTRRPVAN